MASAVARPMPRPAPVTIATRPCSHPGASGILSSLRWSLHGLVPAFVSGKTGVETEVFLRVLPAGLAIDRLDRQERPRRGSHVVRPHQEAGPPVDDDLRQRAATVGNHGSPGGLRLGGDHAKRLLPFGRTEDRARVRHDPPQLRPHYATMNRDAGLPLV